jgi:hypothetical protein
MQVRSFDGAAEKLRASASGTICVQSGLGVQRTMAETKHALEGGML